VYSRPRRKTPKTARSEPPTGLNDTTKSNSY
jgi:hypothetical protein